MADPANYCSWFSTTFCITQSEWAAWAQAGLTVATFAFAMWRQKVATDKSTAERQIADQAVTQKQSEGAKILARATAISIRIELNTFLALAKVLPKHLQNVAPPAVFKDADGRLNLRLRALDALNLLEASQPALDAIDAAHLFHNYLRACANQQTFEERDVEHLNRVCIEYQATGQTALDSIRKLIDKE